MIRKIAWFIGIAMFLGVVVGVAILLRNRDNKSTEPPKAPATEAKASPWEVLKSRVEGNEFFRCQPYDDCRGYVVRGNTGDAKITGILGSDGSLTITVESEKGEETSLVVVYADTNGDGTLDKVSGSNFPGAASVNKMPEGIRKEVLQKYESFVSYLTEAADKTVENALYGTPKE